MLHLPCCSTHYQDVGVVCGTGADQRIRPAGVLLLSLASMHRLPSCRNTPNAWQAPCVLQLPLLSAVKLQLVNGTKDAQGKLISGRLMLQYQGQWGTVRQGGNPKKPKGS